jgi:hypothetical protein
MTNVPMTNTPRTTEKLLKAKDTEEKADFQMITLDVEIFALTFPKFFITLQF